MEQTHVLGMACGYYLSRFDDAYATLGFGNMSETHRALGRALGVEARSIQNWRDEFDVVHDNRRKGWRNRKMAPSRIRMVEALRRYEQDELLSLISDATKSPMGPAALRFLRTAPDVDATE